MPFNFNHVDMCITIIRIVAALTLHVSSQAVLPNKIRIPRFKYQIGPAWGSQRFPIFLLVDTCCVKIYKILQNNYQVEQKYMEN